MILSLKARLIFLFSIITYCIAGLSALICSRVMPQYSGIFVSLGITLISFVFHQIAKRKFPLFYIVSCCLNAIASGFVIGTYYSKSRIHLAFTVVLILLIAYALFMYLICYFFDRKSKDSFARNIIGGIMLLCYLLLIIFFKKNAFISYGLFVLIIVTFYFILCIKTLNTPRNVLSDLSLASFSIYFIIAFIVALLLTDGDLGELFDPDFLLQHKKKGK